MKYTAEQVRAVAPEYPAVQSMLLAFAAQLEAPAVPDCPYPCGWRELHAIAVRNGACLAIGMIEGEPVSERVRAVALDSAHYAINIASAMLAAAPQPVLSMPPEYYQAQADGLDVEPAAPAQDEYEVTRLEDKLLFKHNGNVVIEITGAPLPDEESFCYCGDHVSLQMVSGGGSEHGYLGRVTLKIDGQYVEYERVNATSPAQDSPARLYEELRAIIDGGSESMTHADAVALLKEWSEAAEIRTAQDAPGLDELPELPLATVKEAGPLSRPTAYRAFQMREYARAALQVKANAGALTPAPGVVSVISRLKISRPDRYGDVFLKVVDSKGEWTAQFKLGHRASLDTQTAIQFWDDLQAALSQRPDDTELLRECQREFEHYLEVSEELLARLAARLGE